MNVTKEELLSTAKPILFNTDMIRAILSGQKTVTRRLPSKRLREKCAEYMEYAFDKRAGFVDSGVYAQMPTAKEYYENHKPYAVGQILYVRETWAVNNITPHDPEYVYRADHDCTIAPYSNWLWKPSIHMPKEAARIFLKITSVRMERLQDMTEDDVFKEGAGEMCACPNERTVYFPDGGAEPCWNMPDCCDPYYCEKSYPELFGEIVWNNTIPKEDRAVYGWDANPWVWVIEFERVEVKT